MREFWNKGKEEPLNDSETTLAQWQALIDQKVADATLHATQFIAKEKQNRNLEHLLKVSVRLTHALIPETLGSVISPFLYFFSSTL